MSTHQPPKLARKILEWYSGQADIDDLVGDLDEWFYKTIRSKSVFRTKLLYWKQVWSLMFSYAIQKRKANAAHSPYSVGSLSPVLVSNYFKVAVRNLARHKYFSLVNIFGLAMGMSIGLFFISMLSYVYSYDNFHAQQENIYRIISTRTDKTEQIDLAPAPAALALKLKDEFALPVDVVRINRSLNVDVIREKQDLTLSGYYTEPNFLSIFNFPLVKGSNTLQKPKTLLLTESTARKFFGDVDALGKTLELKGQGEFEVTGILQDLPKNTHFSFDALASYSSLPMHAQGNGTLQTDWTEYLDQYVYFRTRGAADAQAVQHALQQMEKQVYKTGDEVTASFHLQALSAINPGPDLRRGLGVVWDYVGLTVFGIVSLLILLPACFNYTNISIARALKRAKEIGMRKTMGSLNEHIFAQFITETVVITLISLLLAIGVFMLMRGEFLSMLAESSALDLSLTGLTLLGFVLFALLTGFVSGVAPALFFSRLNPIQALKNKTARGSLSGQKVRKALMVFQFAASFSFILLLVVFARQYRYTLNFNFGFQKENILDVALQDVNKQNFRTEFSRLPSVQDISMSSGVPGISVSRTYASEPERMDSLEVFQLFVDHRYIPNMKLSLLAGKNFTEADGVSEKSIIVNEEFLNVYKITSPIDALGRSFLVEGHDLTVIGIVKNFNFTSLREPIKSFFFRYNSNYFTHANIKVVFSDAYLGLSEMERTWQSIHGNKPFTAKFLDDEINDAYDFYSVMLKLLGYLGALALTISILGMLGMVVYTAESRTKEVGIRKVMGASSLGLTFLLSRDFIKLILLGALLATPLAVLVLDRLLMQAQYYSVTLSFWDVLFSLIILLTFGLLAIISQTLKTASTNPVDTLRVE